MKGREKVLFLAKLYEKRLYSGGEVVNLTYDELVDAADVVALWADVPDWVQVEIANFLFGSDSFRMEGRLFFKNPDEPSLIPLRNWLIAEEGYR